ncbi:MAG: glyoxalase/bleomycin resistance/extradiol dioxygenase family protein [Sphingobium sp.]|nr:glyoxalase/bleomycin resistance/extradiol dioxygenase family protein [Sphingobium sp.]
MSVEALEHINIIATDLDHSEAFYCGLLLLRSIAAPPPLTPDNARWLVDERDVAIIHLNSMDAPRKFDRDLRPAPTGALHHVALRCRGYEAMLGRLNQMGVRYHQNELPTINLKQIFLSDPQQILLELNFFGN